MRKIDRNRGDTKPFKFQLLSETSGTAKDITGYTFLMTADTSQSPTDATNNIFQLTGVITNASDGQMEFRPSASDVDYTGFYYYDVEATDASGFIETLEKGRLRFRQDITK